MLLQRRSQRDRRTLHFYHNANYITIIHNKKSKFWKSQSYAEQKR